MARDNSPVLNTVSIPDDAYFTSYPDDSLGEGDLAFKKDSSTYFSFRPGAPAAAITGKRFPTPNGNFELFASSVVLNVQDFGATGDGTTDDTAAFVAAIAAATNAVNPNGTIGSIGRGAVVYAPHGVYKITASLSFPNGVALQGDGMWTSQLKFVLDVAVPGARWVSDTQYGWGGFVRDISLAGSGSCTHVLHVVNWGNFDVQNALIGGGVNGIYIADGISCTFHNVYCQSNSGDGLVIEDVIASVTTTHRFYGCWFQANGRAGAKVSGSGINFTDCIFESNGAGTHVAGYGIEIPAGTVNLVGCYFENNTRSAVAGGTSDDSSVSVISPLFVPGGYVQADAYCVYLDKVTSGMLSGFRVLLGGLPLGIGVTTNCRDVTILDIPAGVPAQEPTLIGGTGNICDYLGLIVYNDTVSGQRRVTGVVALAPGDATTATQARGQITTCLVASAVVPEQTLAAPSDAVHPYASVTVPCLGVLAGDSALVSFTPALPTGVVAFASCGAGSVVVTLLAGVSAPGTITISPANNTTCKVTVLASSAL